ncbi:MAG: hypothetical protein IKF53_05195 [Clostridia bacterium]|nr:hypothetical protein [Clostridia bacterium]
MKIQFTKKKLWLAIAILAVIVVAAAITATVMLLNQNTEETGGIVSDNKIYWNIDRQWFYGKGEGGVSSRIVDQNDGYYHILLAAEGRPIERKAKTQTVVNKIDAVDAMGIQVDEKTRAIIDVTSLSDMGYSYMFKGFYVTEVKGNKITANSSASSLGKTKTIEIKSTTPIYDVSVAAQSDAGMPVRLESLEVKDQITVIMDKEKNIYAVYIIKRSRIAPVYWNIERKYDSKKISTTRTPDQDGVYSLLMAVNGEQVTVKCKDVKLVTQIDAFASKSCGLDFDEEGYVSAVYSAAKTTGGRSVASWYDVINLDDLNFVAEKHLEAADKGKQADLMMDSSCGVFNVSANHENFIGERTTLQVGDRVQGFTDPSGRVVVLFVVRRPVQADFYWNAYRMYDSKKQSTTRTREADGYYHVLMCKDGKTYDIKVADKSVMDKIDSYAAKSMGLRVVNGVAVEYIAASTMYESKASWFDVEKFVDSKTIHVKKNLEAKDKGKEYDFSLADYCKVYNATETYTDHIGEETDLRVGDRIQAWMDYTGKLKYVFVVSRPNNHSVVAHMSHTCEECGSNVQWTPWTSGNTLPTTSGHYYLCGDVCAPQSNVKKDQNVVLCLNGYNIKAAGKRIYATFEEGAKLSIHDCKNKGKLYSTYGGPLGSTQGPIVWARYGTVNLYGGTYVAPTQKISNNGAVICADKGTTLTIKNSTIIGGKTTARGGAVYASGSVNVTIIDSTIKAGVSENGKGDAMAITGQSKLNLSGKVVISGGRTNLYISGSGPVIFKDKLSEGSSIGVSFPVVGGKVSSNYIEGVEKYFTADDQNLAIYQNGTFVYAGYKIAAHNTNHTCEECGNNVEWTPWTYAGSLPKTTGHYYLCGNVTSTSQTNIDNNQNVVLCLNGYTVKGTADRVYSIAENSNLTITDCTAKGKVYNGKTGSLGTTQGTVFWLRSGKLNIFGGTIVGPSASTAGNGTIVCAENGTQLNVKNATLIGGTTVRQGTNVNTGNGGVIAALGNAKVSLNNVNITSGKANGGNGDAIFMNGTSRLSLSGKVAISGGTNQVYLASDAFITFDDTLTEGSSLGISSANNIGKITTNYVDGAENYIFSNNSKYTITRIGSALYINDGSIVVPAHANEHTCKHCNKDVEWEPWDETTKLPTKSGHYYLMYDVTTGSNEIPAGEDVVLCLNGHKVEGTGVRVYNIRGKSLTVIDCAKTGTIKNVKTGNLGTTQGAVFWLRNGTLNLFGGSYDASGVTTQGRGVVICAENNTNVNIEGAEIIGGTTERIEGNLKTGNGGDISTTGNAKLSLKDVNITSGTSNGGFGDAIYMADTSSLTVSGLVNISGGTNQVYLAKDAYITFGDKMSEGSSLGVKTENTSGKISSNYKDGVENYILSNREGAVVEVKDNAVYLLIRHDVNKVCEHCGLVVEWTKWTSTTSLPTTVGHYYLDNDVTCGQNNVNAGVKDIVLCLDGHSVKGTAGRVYSSQGVSLTIMDCAGTGKISNTKTANLGTTQGDVFWIRKGTLNLIGGSYDASGVTTQGRGTVICAESGTKINITGSTLYGGTTTQKDDNPNTGRGGVIAALGTAQITLKDVNIHSGSSHENKSDAIYLTGTSKLKLSGKINITGGTNQVYLEKGTYIEFDDLLTEGSNIVIDTASDDGKISTNYVENAENYLLSDKLGYVVTVHDDALYLEEYAGKLSSVSKNSITLDPKLSVYSPINNLLREAGTK